MFSYNVNNRFSFCAKKVLLLYQKRFSSCVKTDFLITLRIGSYLSHLVRKPTICICENKDADQLRGNREADQRLCFRYGEYTSSSS